MKKIAISSAKGGVGKTTISYLMAKKLKDAGLNVGLFDGDLYGPNILNLFDVNPRSFKSFNDKNTSSHWWLMEFKLHRLN